MNLIDIAEQALVDFHDNRSMDYDDRDLARHMIGSLAIPFRTLVLDELAQMTDDQIIAYVRAK